MDEGIVSSLTAPEKQELASFVKMLVASEIEPIRTQNDRLIALELELKHQRELIEQRFKHQRELMEKGFKHQRELMEKGFEAVDKRFELMEKQIDKRFEAVDKRLELMEKQMNKRFRALQWMMGLGFTLMSISIVLIKLFS